MDLFDDAFCVIELVFDDAGRPVDYRFLETNSAFEGHTGMPGELLLALDEFAHGPDGAAFATACYTISTPRRGSCATPGGAPTNACALAGGRGAASRRAARRPRAVDDAERPDASIILEPGSLLVRYSVGLVERRRESISEGLVRVERAAKAHLGAPVEELCDRLVTELGADHARDEPSSCASASGPTPRSAGPSGGSRRRRRRGAPRP